MAILDIFKKKKEVPEGDIPPPPGGAPPLTPSAPPGAPAGAQPAPLPPGAQMPAGAPLNEVPLSQVATMQQQGLTNNQIIQTLQRQGYPATQIYDALAQSEAKKSIEPMNLPHEPTAKPMGGMKHPDTESMVEQIIEEKWTTLQKDITKMNEWKDTVNSRIDKLEQSAEDIRSDLEGLHKAIVQRIGEYDKTLVDVGTEIKAMEKVFQKVLPELTTNIQELSRITKNVKGGAPSAPELGKIPESLAAKLAATKTPKPKKTK